MNVVYQPIVDISRGVISGVEALARFRPEPRQGPDRWFADAAEAGLGPALEILAIRRAVERADELPGTYLAVNVSPQTMVAPGFERAITVLRTSGRQLVLELTEHTGIERYDAVAASLARLRAMDVLISVDDAGAGYSSFRHILELRPDFIKLDRSVVRDIDRDPVRRALASAMTEFATEIGSNVIAEGVERTAELRALSSAGITHVQGYLCGRPSPVPLPPPTLPESDPRPGVLIVDDDAIVRLLVTRIVRNSGLRLVGAAVDGTEAIRQASVSRPDVVILDLSMPVLAGADALPTLRAMLPDATIIVMSSNPSKLDGDLLRAGADALVSKDDTTLRLPALLARAAERLPAVSDID